AERLKGEADERKRQQLVPSGPGPDQLAWSVLTDRSSPAALKRFAEQCQDSPLRKKAEARIAVLEEAEQIWNFLKDSLGVAALKRFAEQFEESPRQRER